MSDDKVHMSPLRLFAIAAIAGMAIGAVGVYVMAGTSGNNAGVVAETQAACQGREEAIARVDAAARGEVAAMLAADDSRSLGDLVFTGPDGEPMAMADLSGKTLLVNLWATWCAPCVKELPTLDTLAKRTDGQLGVIAISQDMAPQGSVRAFLEKLEVGSLGAYHDDQMALSGSLDVQVLPTTILFDAEGREVWRYIGDFDWSGEEASRLLAEAGADGRG
jgi:thiol-disulfide isomerase/thioredoxin